MMLVIFYFGGIVLVFRDLLKSWYKDGVIVEVVFLSKCVGILLGLVVLVILSDFSMVCILEIFKYRLVIIGWFFEWVKIFCILGEKIDVKYDLNKFVIFLGLLVNVFGGSCELGLLVVVLVVVVVMEIWLGIVWNFELCFRME